MVQTIEGPAGKDATAYDRVYAVKPTARVERLREAFLHVERSSSIDRARIEGRVMRETEGEPMITR
ncbi:MAG: hypothetical protein ACUZ8A_07690, partial [Candidatus Bathyanammoxibius sp.]